MPPFGVVSQAARSGALQVCFEKGMLRLWKFKAGLKDVGNEDSRGGTASNAEGFRMELLTSLNLLRVAAFRRSLSLATPDRVTNTELANPLPLFLSAATACL